MAGDPRTVLIANPGADLYGSDRMTVESVKALVGAGYTVFVTVPGPGPLIELLTAAGATVLEQPTPIIRKSLLSAKGLVQLLRETVESWGPSWRLLQHTNAGTVVVNTITPPLWFPLARLAGRRVACHLHEAESTVSPAVRWAMYLPLQVCNRVIANSAYTKQVLADSSIGLVNRTRVVHNTVPGPAEVVEPQAAIDGAPRLLYVGRLSQRKGPQVVVAAMESLRQRGIDSRLDVVGAVFPGNEPYEQGLRAQVHELGLDDRVEFHGFQSDVWPFLAACDIAVVPSTEDESFGNTAAEAALAARPVVVSAIAGLKEATSASEAALLVTPGDPVEVADAIATIVDQWPEFTERARGDADRVARKFSSLAYADGLIDALGLPR